MDSILRIKALAEMVNMQQLLSQAQFNGMIDLCGADEANTYKEFVISLAQVIFAIPINKKQVGKGDDTIAYLNYNTANTSWFITELEVVRGLVEQVVGYVIVNGNAKAAKLEYFQLNEILNKGAEMNHSFVSCPLREIKAIQAK